MSIYPDAVPIAMWLTGYNAFLTGLMVFLKKRCRGGGLYFLANIAIFGWSGCISFMLDNRLTFEAASIAGRCANASALLIPSLWLDFVLTYTNTKENFKKILLITYAVTFLVFPFSFTEYFAKSFRPEVGFEYYPLPGPLYFVFSGLFAFCVSFSFWIFWKAVQKADFDAKKDYQWVFGASLYGFFLGSLSFLPVFDIKLPQYNLLIMPTWQMLLTYAMIHHQAFDVEQIANAFQREKMAAIGIMAASLNHEMRNPLYIAKGKMEGYRDGIERRRFDFEEKDKKTEEMVNAVSRQLDRTLDIMQRFSDFARPQHMAKGELLNLKDLFQEASELVSYEIQRKNIRLVMEADAKVSFWAHKRQMEEILVNLMINASQALGEKGGEIRIAGKRSGDRILVEVSDNGPGMDEETQKRIFEPFFSTKGEKGSGLGLYITKQLVEKNGGKIEVRSKPGAGTQFILSFDLNDTQNRSSVLKPNVR